MYFKFISLILIFFISLEAKDMQHGSVGYLVDGMNDVKYKDARIAFQMWFEDLATNNNIVADIKYYEEAQNIVQDFQDKKIYFLIVNPIFYLKYRDILDPLAKEYWVMQKNNKKSMRYIVLAKQGSSVESLADLKGKRVATRSDNYLGKMFLDAEILTTMHRETNNYIQEFVDSKKFSTALLQTYFSKVDACIVPEYTLDLVAEMNPALKKELKVIARSEEIFFPIIATFHIETTKEVIDQFKKSVENIHKSARGENILNLFKMQGLRVISKEKIRPLVEYYNQYLELKHTYAKK